MKLMELLLKSLNSFTLFSDIQGAVDACIFSDNNLTTMHGSADNNPFNSPGQEDFQKSLSMVCDVINSIPVESEITDYDGHKPTNKLDKIKFNFRNL